MLAQRVTGSSRFTQKWAGFLCESFSASSVSHPMDACFCRNRTSSAGAFCCQLLVQGYEGDLAIKTLSKLVYTTISTIPRKNDCQLLKADFNTHPFPRKKKKSFFWLVVFFPLKRRPFQNNLLHPAQQGKRKYPVQLHLVGAFRNNFNSYFLLNVSPFVCITRCCSAVEAKL